MKFPFLHAAFLLLFIVAILAGCSSSPSVQGTTTPSPGTIQTIPATSSPATLQTATETPVPKYELSQLVLSPAEMPFTVVDEKNLTPDLNNPTLSRFGAIRGYSRFATNEKTESVSSVHLGQVIVEYPPGNATLAFAEFVKENKNAEQTYFQIVWQDDPWIGDESCAFTVIDRSGSVKPRAIIMFRKSSIMESMVLIAPLPDTEALTRAAKLAAAKIP